MRKFIKEKSVLMLALLLLVTFLWNNTGIVADAATKTPSFTKTTLVLRGIGETYDINIKNKVAKSKYSWTSSNKKVAKVASGGIVTSIASGTALIKCKITYPTKKTKTLSCKVTVTTPATAVNIKELPIVNNAYQLAINGTVDLEAALTPSDSSDKLFWYIDKDNVLSDPTCVTLDSNNQGIVTGVKAGKAVIRVKAAKSATQVSADASNIDDTIIIEVVAQTADVKSADIVSSNQITVVFDNAMQQSTLINTDGTLSSNITITLGRDVKNVVAEDPGKLTASLSTDMKTLTITSEKALRGTYGINFSSKILTTTGIAIADYYKQLSFIDTVAPYITGVTYDDSGMIATINFSETIDFTNFAVRPATVVSSSTTVSTNSLNILSNTSNYVISTDKKSVSINMSNISSTDYGKYFQISFVGIKDLEGNVPTSLTLTATVATDTSPKPQAVLMSISRTGYNTLTALFTRSIKTAGFIQISGGSQIYGVVDSTNPKKVNYTLTGADLLLTGVKTVSVGFWNSYNVITTDTTANQFYSKPVDFTVETTGPYVIINEYDIATNILTLTYSEPVSLTAASGIFTATLNTSLDEVIPGLNISYTTVIHNLGDNIVQLKLNFNSTKTGIYTFTMPQGFATDNFMNLSISKAILINNTNGTAELPGPYMIAQSLTNLNEITIMFANKLDLASASLASNYKITGVNVLSARVDSNSADTGATVVLTVQSIDVTTSRPMTITGVKGFGNSFAAISTYSTSVLLKENTPPRYIDPPVFNTSTKNVVNLNFSEAIQGTLSVTVTQIYGSTQVTLTNTVFVSGNSASISLGSIPTNGSYLKIVIVANNITDAAGNVATFASTTLGVGVQY
jgi:hypothetical protein